eukprot:gnl/TRDRNA2_/TRDRNA2_176405_c1_seq2.p1 gnl/TRDRNA2_/TRDRNA2_176405_c1~~gnl/TRDRNA2_/TRDRNA2_176405_c1_seq2.p1  ORF type:complete len:528 (+),score=76.65 gnl/TRDRNA2_/TRDRNA2_176405_c1_seq2:63-1646(+)
MLLRKYVAFFLFVHCPLIVSSLHAASKAKEHAAAASVLAQSSASQSTAAISGTRAGGGPSQISVILACADEGEYAWKTAAKVFDRTPADRLQEIIVVDDGSATTMADEFTKGGLDESTRQQKKIKIIRHKETLGLMIAKKTGGDAAVGDILVFFDCHVSPQPNWHIELSQLIDENPRRMVVPAITDLDLDTWEEKPNSAVNTKCYLTWDADFNWFDDASPEVPVMSGGLLALSNSWWKSTGGYDSAMRGWGGENLDQSLRAWLCGGEILRAKSSRVAHMWRGSDGRTAAHYKHVSGANNRLRVVAAWYDVFAVKYGNTKGMEQRAGDLTNIRDVKEKLHCKPFVHFLHHFRDVYVNGGIIAPKIFQLKERKTGLCLTLAGNLALGACQPENNQGVPGQNWFHWANRDQEIEKMGVQNRSTCCSGLRLWGGNTCLDSADNHNNIQPYLCDVTGSNRNQQYKLLPNGQVSHDDGKCMSLRGSNSVGLIDCNWPNISTWEEITSFEPIETKLYREQLFWENLKDPVFPTV